MPKTLLPPTYFLASLGLMAALALLLPVADVLPWAWRVLGLAPIAAGVWLNLAADRAFKARATTIKPFERSSALLTDGVFRISRNPMYLGMILILVGVAMLIGSLSPFFVVAGFTAIIEMRFIPLEERMLAETFGNAWTAYSARTRRWL
ncbi:MAG: isoprenylcysteine carboxylmethyltransferase family protein [Hyphomicrobiales bacterium]|nr:isoprenylcysteine carboxylmethyltransferase family protein [Hyphomicrobiales bacterium]